MKLASLKQGRDGALVVVSRDLTQFATATDIAPTLQVALDCWTDIAPALERRYEDLNCGRITSAQTFEAGQCASPLPRAYQWADGSAYVNHVELVRKARGAVIPDSFWTDPLMYQGGSDTFLAPNDPIVCRNCQQSGLDFEAEIAVVTDDVPMGTLTGDAGKHIKLLMLVNDVSLRGLIPSELAKGFGFFQSKPSSAFSPVAVTPDELGDAWQDNKVHLPLMTYVNGDLFGKPNAGIDMTFDFARLISHGSQTRALSAGTIIGSGTVSNKLDGGPGKPIEEGGVGYSCIAEQRMIEVIHDGEASTPFLTTGDTVRIEMLDHSKFSIFGSIEQQVVAQ